MKILVAVDFGLFGKAQISAIRSLRCSKDTSVKVLHVSEPIYWDLQTGYPEAMQNSHNVIAYRNNEAERLVHDVSTELKETTSIEHVHAEVREGSISDQIVDAARSFGADLIVVGTRGKSGIARLLLGSISQAVSMHAECSVLIARSAETSAHNTYIERRIL